MRILNLIIAVLFTINATAQTKVVADVLVGNENRRNFITNPSCDTNSNGITLTGSATKTKIAQTFGGGIAPYSCQIDGVASGDTAIFTGKAMDQYLIGQNCQVSFRYALRDSLSGAAGPVFASAINVDGYQTPEVTLTSSLSNTTMQVFNPLFNIPCGGITSGGGGAGAGSIGRTAPTLKIRFGTPGNASRIYVSQVYSGEATNIVQVGSISDPISYGTITIGAVTTPPTKGTVAVDTITGYRVGKYWFGEYTYQQTAGSAGPGSGDYLISLPTGLVADTTLISVYTGTVGAAGYSNAVIGEEANYTGTGPASGIGKAVLYNTTQFRIQAGQFFSNFGFMGSGYTPLNVAIAFKVKVQVPIQGWSANTTAAVPAQTDYGPTAYTPTFTNFGTVTGINCTHERKGQKMRINCTFTTGTTVATEARVSLPNSLLTISTIPTVSVVGFLARAVATVGSYTVLAEPSTGYLTFGLQDGSRPGLTKLLGNVFSSTSTNSFFAEVPIEGWAENQRAPTLVGSFTTDDSRAIKYESATVDQNCTGSPCTILSRIGSAISVTRTSAGVYVAAFSPAFSSAPQCNLTAISNSANMVARMNSVPTTSSLSFVTVNPTVVADSGFTVECKGPR